MRSHKRHFRLRTRVAALTITGLLASACASTPSADSTGHTTEPSVEVTTTQTTPEPTELANAADVITDAVDALVEAGTYAFEAKLLVTIQGQPTEIELEGWVDGSDRELVMKIDRQSVVTRVIDGVATVERDGETVEVPLEEAGAPPSILILKSIQSPTFGADDTITGKLNASDLAATEYDVNGSATIEITVASNGNLAGYSILSNNDSWKIDVTFSDIGEDPNR